MKKSTLEALYNLANGTGSMTDELRADIVAEYERTTAKSRANTELYDKAWNVLAECTEWDKPMMVKELWVIVEANMPDGFSASKMQYGMLNKWSDKVTKHDNGKDAFKYSRK